MLCAGTAMRSQRVGLWAAAVVSPCLLAGAALAGRRVQPWMQRARKPVRRNDNTGAIAPEVRKPVDRPSGNVCSDYEGWESLSGPPNEGFSFDCNNLALQSLCIRNGEGENWEFDQGRLNV